MKLSRNFIFFLGILFLVTFFLGKKISVMLTGKFAEGKILDQSDNFFHGRYGQQGTLTQSNFIQFEYNGSTYSFQNNTAEEESRYKPVTVLFDPENPNDAFIYDFINFWVYGSCGIVIGLVPLAAACFSFIDKNERLEISSKRIGLIKVNSNQN